jgi:serine/threonine-protein kinase
MQHSVQEGDVLDGKYRVERVLGEGGMGVVVAARHLMLEEQVALKFLQPEIARQGEAVARFLREARAAVRIKSEHVARVTDVGQLANGSPYMVMEYLDGKDLSLWLREHRRLSVEDVVDYVAQACEALADAHSLGIVHRDLKPSNLMLVQRSDGSPCVKVLDFGISKVTSEGGAALNMTRTTAVLGSPLYMSPEQMMSTRDVDARTDVWSLGVILYELLAGTPPFVAETLTALSVMVATHDVSPLRLHRPEIPVGLEAVVHRCLTKRREDRFQSVGELALALAPFAPARSRTSIERASRLAGSATAAGMALQASTGAAAQSLGGASSIASFSNTSNEPVRSKRMLPIALGVGFLLTAAIAGAVLYFGREPSAADSAPSAGASEAAATPPPAPELPPAQPSVTAPEPQVNVVEAAPAASASSPPAPAARKPATRAPVKTPEKTSVTAKPAVPPPSEPPAVTKPKGAQTRKPNYDDM